MAGILELLSGLLGGQQPQGMLANNAQPQGMLQQQPQPQGVVPPNFLQNLSKALIAQGQPSIYKQGTGSGLISALNGGLNGDVSGIERQAMMNNPNIKNLAALSGNIPSGVQEYQYYASLPPSQREEFLKVKRAQQMLNLGGTYASVNPATGGISAQYEKTLAPENTPETKAAQALATKSGENLAANQNSLPDLLANSQNAIQQIQELRDHPGLSDAVGAKNMLSGAAPMALGASPVAGSDAAGFMSRLDQLKGGQFLQAYQTLKGGGAITEVEGQKAQNAIARMSTAQKETDFNQALNDYEDIIKQGMSRARQKAGISISNTPQGNPSANNGVVSYSDYFK